MKLVKVMAVVLIGPIIGLILGAIIGGFFLPADPSPGDGFLPILTGAAGGIVFLTGSVLLAVRIWTRSSDAANAR